MSQLPSDPFEERLIRAGHNLRYPPTPNIVSMVQNPSSRRMSRMRMFQQLPAWTLIAILILLAGLIAVPEVRAAVGRFLRIGSVEIILPPPTPTTATIRTIPAQVTPSTTRPITIPAIRALDLAGEVTLDEAEQRATFPIRLPAYPSDLGPPDQVYLQNLAGQTIILVWLEPDQPDHVRLALYQLESDAIARKLGPQILEHTTVNGQPALWMHGPHILEFHGPRGFDGGQIVQGNVLLWTENNITYRLESGSTLEEALHIAESLH